MTQDMAQDMEKGSRKTRALLLGAVLLAGLAACTPQSQDQLARDAAKQTITPILASRLPGVPVEPAANCVIDNASAGEIPTLAAATVTGTTPETTRLVVQILARPGTIQCIAREGASGAFG